MAATTTRSPKTRRNTPRTAKNATEAKGKAMGAKRQTTKIATPKSPDNFTGKIPCTRLFYRAMPEFKNVRAFCWVILNEVDGVYHTANTYHDHNGLRASYKPTDYQYDLTDKAQKKIDTKLQEQGYLQVESVADFPTWARMAESKSRKSSK